MNWERIAVCNTAFLATQAEICSLLAVRWIDLNRNRFESTAYAWQNNSLAAKGNTRYHLFTAGESYVAFVL